jgi:hypothetical protein
MTTPLEAIGTITTAISLLGKFKSEILKLQSLTKEQVDNFFDKSLSKYLDNQFDKFYSTKTFQFRDEKVKFYETFFPVKLKKSSAIIDTSSIPEDFFKEENYIAIIGNAGSGKTMLMKHFFLNAYTTFYRIPIVIELRHLNEYNGKVIDYIYSVLLENRVTPTERLLEKVMESGKFLFLLDGYDEIFSEHKKGITEEIEKFVDKYSNNYFILTSRPGAEAENLTRFENYYVQDLSDGEIELFVIQQLSLVDESILAKKVIGVIKRLENKDYKDYLRNPLLLSMFLLTFKQYPDLPKSRNKFYWNVFDTLVTKHDSLSKKGGYQHERKTGLQNEDFEKILKWLGYITLFKGKYSFDKQFFSETLKEIKQKLEYDFDIDLLISDLTVSLSLIIIDGLEYKFPHKSFQEYFCAILIKDLDTPNKNKVYSEKFEKIFLQSSSQFSLWGLCMEVDKVNFLEMFVIPNLKEFLENLKLNGFSLLHFTSLTGYEVIIINLSEDNYSMLYSYTINLKNQLLRFLKINFDSIIDNKLLRDNYGPNQLCEIISKYGEPSKFSDTADEGEELYDINILRLCKDDPLFYSNMKIEDSIGEFANNVELKISELEEEIKNEKEQTVSLLDI